MTDVLDRTGSYLGPAVRTAGGATTSIYFGSMLDSTLVRAIEDLNAAVSFDAAEILSNQTTDRTSELTASRTNFRLLSRVHVRSQSSQVLDVIEELQSSTNLSLKRVLGAVGIKYRTYYAWRTDKRIPRPDSLGNLWVALEQIRRLERDLGDDTVARSFRVDPQKRAFFELGDFDSLAASFAMDRVRDDGAAPLPSPSSAVEIAADWMPERGGTPPAVRAATLVKADRRSAHGA